MVSLEVPGFMWIVPFALLVGLSSQNLATILPQGDSRPALMAPHFPDPVHEFIWRNWTLVEPSKLAKILGASVEDASTLAESMGLPRDPAVSPLMLERGYVSLIRRNWHLLPYEQLLELLDMTPERLAFILREEDFLWIKLGRLKPVCEPLRYRPTDPETQKREREIRAVVERDFGEEIFGPCEPRFEFVKDLSLPLREDAKPHKDRSPLRIVYSYVALYGDPLLTPKLNPYPDGLLERLSSIGINGVWLQGLLRDLAPGGPSFPEFGADHEKRLSNLRALVKRAGTYGIGVYLYLNEPRAMPESFFRDRPGMSGVQEEGFRALCTSSPEVRQWMSEALTFLFREVPHLAGIYAITGSENLTHCASHGNWESCERCKTRSDSDIIVEVVEAIERGVHQGNPKASVLMSDWGWKGHGDAREIIPRLPKDIVLMSVSEWSLPIERGGIRSTVGEYSISSVGPGPRALPHWQEARKAGLKIGAEIQFNNTCEIASVPYLPVMDLVAEHAGKLFSSVQLDAMLIGWTMGGYPSPNLQIAQMLSKTPNPERVLDKLASQRFGPGAAHACKAWTLLSDAFREYPFHISVVYTSPVQCGPANPLYPSKTGFSATMWGLPYDDVDGWRGPYPPLILADQFDKVAAGWRLGIEELEQAVAEAPEGVRKEVLNDLHFAKAAAIHFQSVANQTHFIQARDALEGTLPLSNEENDHHRQVLRNALDSEILLARELFTLSREDSCIGFEPSCQYFYLPLDLVEKVINCRWLMAHFGL